MNTELGVELSPILGEQLSRYNLSPLDTNVLQGSFKDWVFRAVNGELDLSLGGIMNTAFGIFTEEVLRNGALMRQLLVVALISALLRCLSDSFKSKSAGEMGFYINYVLIAALAFTSFRLSLSILNDLMTQTTNMMTAAVPLMISLTAVSGNFTGAAVFQPVLMLGVSMMARFVAYVFIPLVTAAMVLHIVNHLTEGGIFTKFTLLLKKIADSLLKFIIFTFLTLLTFQKISVPIVNNLAVKTAKAAADAVPVVGGALNSAMDTVMYFSAAAKSGVLVALLIVICAAAAVPLLKLLAFVFIYRLTAALVQPVCDIRITNCLDGLGAHTGLLLSAGTLTALMFIFSCVIMLSF